MSNGIPFRAIRLSIGYSQADFADAILLSERSIKRIEAGSQNPGRRTVVLLRALLRRPEVADQMKRVAFESPFPSDSR
tara:strand:- start:23 stop:256 length:234 start_codon:yes stop_codon:yes gene_type:complete